MEAAENFRSNPGRNDDERGVLGQKVRGKRYVTGQISHKGVGIGKKRPKNCRRKPGAMRVVLWAMWGAP